MHVTQYMCYSAVCLSYRWLDYYPSPINCCMLFQVYYFLDVCIWCCRIRVLHILNHHPFTENFSLQLFVQMTLRYAKKQNVMSGFFGFNSLVIAKLCLDCSQLTTSSLQCLQSCIIKTFSKSCSDFTKTWRSSYYFYCLCLQCCW